MQILLILRWWLIFIKFISKFSLSFLVTLSKAVWLHSVVLTPATTLDLLPGFLSPVNCTGRSRWKGKVMDTASHVLEIVSRLKWYCTVGVHVLDDLYSVSSSVLQSMGRLWLAVVDARLLWILALLWLLDLRAASATSIAGWELVARTET